MAKENYLLVKSNRIGVIGLPGGDETFLNMKPGVNVVDEDQVKILKKTAFSFFKNGTFEVKNGSIKYNDKGTAIEEIVIAPLTKVNSTEVMKEAVNEIYDSEGLSKLNEPGVVSSALKPFVSEAAVTLTDRLEENASKEKK